MSNICINICSIICRPLFCCFFRCFFSRISIAAAAFRVLSPLLYLMPHALVVVVTGLVFYEFADYILIVCQYMCITYVRDMSFGNCAIIELIAK